MTKAQALQKARDLYGKSGKVRVTQGKSHRGYKRYQIIRCGYYFNEVMGHGDTWEEAFAGVGIA